MSTGGTEGVSSSDSEQANVPQATVENKEGKKKVTKNPIEVEIQFVNKIKD